MGFIRRQQAGARVAPIASFLWIREIGTLNLSNSLPYVAVIS